MPLTAETAEQNSTKLHRKQDLNVFYQVCVFRVGRKNKMAALASDWLRHFQLLPLKPLNGIQRNLTGSKISTSSTKFVFFGPIGKTRWPPWPLIGWDIFDFSSETAERNSTKLYRKQDLNVLYQVCVFSDRSEKQDGRPGLWLAETFSTSLLKPLNGIQRNFTGSKISTSSTKFVFFGPIGKTRWPPWPLIGWDISDFSSETAEWNSTKLDRKQDLNVLYQVCVFSGRSGKRRWPPRPLIGWDIFDFSSETAERNSTKLDRKQDLNVLYQVCVFRTDRKNKMAALASDWLRHFRLLLWNRWTEFNETWQEARSQRPLPSLCFSGRSEKQDGRPGLWLAETFSTSPLKPLNGNSTKLDRKQDLNVLYQVLCFSDRSEKQDGRPGLWLAETFSTSPLKPLNGIPRNLRENKISMSSTKFVFFGPIGKNKMAALASDWLRHFWLLLWNRWMEFNETWQEARSQRPLPSLCFSDRSEKQDGRPGQSAKKVAHCTQVHDMWPFGPLVLYTFCTTTISLMN